ncbi:PAS domain S-box protein [Geovibrio thiophilus]|uniref:histidine kinase n=1 Tax=Geovibrio thiophilus TaxID=139438 RepID=A0A410JVW1_9BACT|nr:PAS domain S-box protein [Geovibrio thiophilus]QAR32326.1 PAS domain S-box protein [Geovibrio thiophilus]
MILLNSTENEQRSGESAPDYAHIFRHANACMLTFEPETTRITDANEAACRLYGYSIEELTSKRILDLTISKPEKTLGLIGRVLEKRIDTVTTCHRDSSGGLHHLEFHSSVFTADGRSYVFNIFHDITEKTLSEIDNRLHAELMNSFLMNDESDIFRSILGVIRKEISSLHGFAGYIDIDGTLVCPSLVFPEKGKTSASFPREKWSGAWGEALNKRKTVVENDCVNIPQGHTPFNNCIAVPVVHKNLLLGEIVLAEKEGGFNELDVKILNKAVMLLAPALKGWLDAKFFHKELMERQRALEYSENKYRTYVNNAPISIFISDHNGLIVEVNKEACRITGYSEKELLSMMVVDLWPPDSVENARKAEEVLFEEGIVSETLKFMRKNKETFFMRISVVKIAENRYIGFCQDATSTVTLENELKKMNESLKEQVKTEVEARHRQEQIIQEQKKLADMGQMINAIAHQWRQPINALGLYVQDAHECWKRGLIDGEYMNTFSDTSMGIIRHISSTIDDFRLFFAPDKKKIHYDAVKEVTELAGLIEVQFAAKHIDIKINGALPQSGHGTSDGKALVYGYAGEFKQAVINIIYNAADAIESAAQNNKRNIRGEINVDIRSTERSVTVSVSDNGTGIPEEYLLKIFEPYFTTKEEGKGTGIGLYMTKLLIEQHMDGRLTASNTGNGACFTINLPRGGALDEE